MPLATPSAAAQSLRYKFRPLGLWATLALPLFATVLVPAGCARVKLKSDPPGARIVYSDNGLPPWRPWRPENKHDSTPTSALVWGGTLRFFRAEKDGYYPSAPQLVDAFMFNLEKVKFTLEPTAGTTAELMKAKGFIWWEADRAWIDPAEKGLVQHNGVWMTKEDRYARQQEEAGLVLYEGRWMSREEKDRLFAGKQQAAGLIQYKNTWVAAADKDAQQRIDAAVDRIFATKPMPLPQMETTLQPRPGRTVLKFFNGTKSPIRVYFSGPETFEFLIDAFQYDSRPMAPGGYRVAVEPVQPELPVQAGEETFEDLSAKGRAAVVSIAYQGDPGALLAKIRAEKPAPIELPNIPIPDIKLPEGSHRGGESASQPSGEERAKAQEIMRKVQSGELTMDQARGMIPESVRNSMGRGGGRGPGGGGGRGPGGGGQGGFDGGGRGGGQGGGGRGGPGDGASTDPRPAPAPTPASE